MSSSIPTLSSPQAESKFWNDYCVPGIAVSGSLFPIFYGLVIKSAQQLDKAIPRMTLIQVVKEASGAAPFLVAQVTIQNGIENLLKENSKNSEQKDANFGSKLGSSLLVGTLSVPCLAIFNARTMQPEPGKSKPTIRETLHALTPKQSAAIVIRETSFLFSLTITQPVSEKVKELAGDHPSVEYGTAFITGAITSAINHPADSALTRLQANLPIEKVSQLYKGVSARAASLGALSVFYKFIKDSLTQKTAP